TELKPLPSYSSLYSHGGHITGGLTGNGDSTIGGQLSTVQQNGSAVLAVLGASSVSNTPSLLPISSLTSSGHQILASSAATNHLSHLNPTIISEASPSIIGRTFSLDNIMLKQEHDALYAPSPPKAVPVIASDIPNEADGSVQGLFKSEIIQLKSVATSH
ncbi:unnamed protein product, partial [Candidula unifasciata]